jgi:hypothetical protein
MKKWKLLLAGLFSVLVCLVVYYFAHYRVTPEIVGPVDRPFKPRLTRPTRKNAVRSDRAKKMTAKTDSATGMKSYRCMKKDLDQETGILRQEIDKDCDGVVDQCVVLKLNEYGEEVHRESYENCGKVPTRCSDIEWNEYGEAVASYTDEDCDGRPDICTTAKFNDHGNYIESAMDNGCDGKLDGKGDVHTCSSYSYDQDGMITSRTQGTCGKHPNGCTEYEYDLRAGIRREKWDTKCDGTVDFCWVWFYRDDPYDYHEFIDIGCDGTWKYCNIYGDDGLVRNKYKGHEACAKKYEDLVKRNLGEEIDPEVLSRGLW